MTFSSIQLPKPDNWQDFEKNIAILFRRVLNDPNTQANGRSGQDQHGVDVYGQREGTHWVGVQCKQKLDKAVTEVELRKEVSKAKGFTPAIKEFILVTTAQRDQKIQTVAREIQEEIENDPASFTVSVWGWEDLCEHVDLYDDVRQSFDPTWSSSAQKTADLTQTIANDVQAMQLDHSKKLDRLFSIAQASSDQNDTALIGQIKGYHEVNENGNSKEALKSLTELKYQCWDDASDIEKYRLLVAIGNCHIALGHLHVAGEKLKQAHNICPSGEKAVSNLAVAHLLHNEEKLAENIASGILRNDPDNAHAATILIQSRSGGELDLLLEDIPEALHTDVSVVVAQISVYRIRDEARWKALARDNYHMFKNDLNEFDHLPWLFSEAIVDTLFSDAETRLSGVIKDISVEERTEAVDILVKRTNHALSQGSVIAASMANNACVGLRQVDRIDEAIELADRASQQFPDDNALLLQRALLALHNDDNAAVLTILPSTIEDPQLVLIRAAALFENKDFEDALSLVSSIDLSDEPLINQSVALEIEFNATLSLHGKAAAAELISNLDKIIERRPNTLRFQNLKVRFLRLLCNTDESIHHLELLSQQYNTDSNPIDRAETGFEAEQLHRNDIVVHVLSGHVSLEYESPPLRTLVAALFDTEDFGALHELLNSMNPTLKESNFGLRTAAKLALDSGAPDAEEKIAQYITVNPNDASILLAQIATWQSKDKIKEISECLKVVDFTALVGSSESRMRLCLIACNHGRVKEAVFESHRILMLNWDNPKIHTQYAGLILMSNVEQSNVFVDCTEVRVGAAVSVVSESETRQYRIDNPTDSAFTSEQISPDSEMAQQLLGRKIGETFTTGQGFRQRNYRIDGIKPIYLDSLHRSFREMSYRFPTFEGNIMLKVDPKSEGGLDDLRELLQEQDNYQKSFLKLYEDGALPMTICAAKTGNDAQEYRAVLYENDVRFRICSGTMIERRLAFHSIRINERSGCVVDALTAHMIYALHLQSFVEAVCGPIHIAQSTLDSFASRSLHFDHAEARSKGRMYLHEGKPAMYEVPDEHLKSASDFRKAEWGWVQENTSVTAVIPDNGIPSELRELESTVGVRLFDSSIIARTNDFLFISEDKELREISTNLLGTRGTWLQPILEIAFRKGLMTKNQYCEVTTSIALSGVSFYPIRADCLFFQAHKDGFKLSSDFEKLLYFLGTPHVVIGISINVVGSFLSMIWNTDIAPTEKLQYASAIFKSLTQHRKSEQITVLKEISNAASSYGYGIPDLIEHAQNWYRGHSIGL